MSNCTSGCRTQDHESYAQCLQSKATRVAYCSSATGRDYTSQKKWDKELASYKEARSEGIQPAGTTTEQVTRAKAISDKVGQAYQA